MTFFFSSRRRHTRSLCDWSSDVCSSDLQPRRRLAARRTEPQAAMSTTQESGQPPAQPAVLSVRGLSVTFDTYKGDRKSTRLNSSHTVISYAVFCLKKKNNYVEHLSRVHT